MKRKINNIANNIDAMDLKIVDYMLSITDAAAYLKVSDDTLRLWDKDGKLKPYRTPGGHRRYTKEQLDEFMKLNSNQVDYGSLYEHLCSAQYIADELHDMHAEDIMKIRQEVGDILLKIHEQKARV